MSRYEELPIVGLKKYSVKDRMSKVNRADFAHPGPIKLREFWDSLPSILKAADMKQLIEHCVEAKRHHKPIIVALGGHVIKCGLAPLLIDLIAHQVITGLASNGSVTIHDFEISLFGQTSEDVATALADGSFGMATETCDGINRLITEAAKQKEGYGEALGKYLYESNPPYQDLSLLAAAYHHAVPFTVHVALGTDIVHQHDTADGAAIGDCSMRDFRIFCQELIELNDGGVFLNFGSAVIIPEVFLKAITVVRNLGYPLRNFYTAVFDMNQHYRPAVNVVQRPTLTGGQGYYFVGHHELMIPLFLLSLRERLTEEGLI